MAQAIATSKVPNKVQLGLTLTQGLVLAPIRTSVDQATEESLEEIKKYPRGQYKMAQLYFIRHLACRNGLGIGITNDEIHTLLCSG